MKRILITGTQGYIGSALAQYLRRWPEEYQVDFLSLREEAWRQADFGGYDAIVHAAAIVHQPKSKDDPSQAELYDRVNHQLTRELAQKAKNEGVCQFLFLSSESVYGLHAPVGQTLTITADTPLNPTDNYGISKLKAEKALTALRDDHFRVAILRPPMIYGRDCKGNYRTLARLAEKLPVFPNIANQRSMFYIGNLCEFLRLLIQDEADGIFCPQNTEYVSTSRMVQEIAKAHGKHIHLVGGCAWVLNLLSHVTPLAGKAFGSLCYDKSLSDYPQSYNIVGFEQSIAETEGGA